MSNFTFRFLSCELCAARGAPGKRAKRAERGEERGSAGEERRGKKLTALIWNQKGECSLAVTQILHLHLYKTGSPVSFSGSLLSPPPPPFLFPSLSLSTLSVRRGSGRCHFRHVFCTQCTFVCVNCGPSFGGGGSDEEDLFESSRARLCSRTQHGAADTWSA